MTPSDQPDPSNDAAAGQGTRPPVALQTGRQAVSRRSMLRGVTVGGLSLPLLAACGGGSDDASSASDTAGSGGSSGSSEAESPSASGGSSAPAAAGLSVPASDVPVGGGAIFPDDKVVVTQPAKGDFKAFSAVCTHQGCLVAEVKDEQIVCNCHGSHFSITDGAPVAGPATAALGAKKVAVKGGRLTVS
jgi:nitrite reductase/ring-hydroxylating ferredoxin subunit